MTKTKRVRIAVAMDAEGCATFSQIADGWTQEDLDELSARSGVLRFTLVEQEFPLPEEPATVRGEVVDG